MLLRHSVSVKMSRRTFWTQKVKVKRRRGCCLTYIKALLSALPCQSVPNTFRTVMLSQPLMQAPPSRPDWGHPL